MKRRRRSPVAGKDRPGGMTRQGRHSWSKGPADGRRSVGGAPRLALLVAVLLLGPMGGAVALDFSPRQWAETANPFTDVGNRSVELSQLCRLGKFNQRRIAETFIRYSGKEGRGLLGIAKRGYNLYDPLGKAEADKTYHFLSDGTSRCRVFVAP